MSPISLGLNLLLATLLSLTLLLGWRLNRRLKALKDSHAGFAAAVADLDRAAARAERGLAELRAATDEAVEFLSGRIEKGRELASKLERLTAVAGASADRVAAQPPAAPASGPERSWSRPVRPEPMRDPGSPVPSDVETAAEALVLRLSEALDGPGAAPAMRRAPRPRASIDDDLFEAPDRAAHRTSAGNR